MTNARQKLTALRAHLKDQKLDGFIIPRMSEYQGEFVADYAERLEWLTDFTGSAGIAVVLAEKAVLLVDGRYTIQVAQQADKTLYEFENYPRTTAAKWLAENAKRMSVIGYDPWLLTALQVRQIEKTLADVGIKFRAVDNNPVDAVWAKRPKFPMEKAEIFPEEFAGVSSAEKRKVIAKILKERKLSACMITLPDSLAWLLNVRGNDVEHTPVVLSFGIIHDTGDVEWFVHPEKISPSVKKHLGPNVEIHPPDKIGARISMLKGRIGLDSMRAPAWFRIRLGNRAVEFKDPCIDPKAIKNKQEQAALRAAHERDGAAVVNFLHWLSEHKGKLTELQVVKKLEEFRRKNKSYRGPSFDTISGWGANGAIVHYRATDKTNATIKGPGLLLLDSGGQYNDGTTDITRTIGIGEPTNEMKERFTLVLKGHIAVGKAKFPEGTNGAQIDALARQPLWNAGLDYAHGTGHGVGCFLSVHEESASLSPRGVEPLKAGMFLSNEPGYYKEGAYGIRTESLVLVKSEKGEERKMLGFETFTLVPIDRNLIEPDMLTGEERKWLNKYHANVMKIIGPLVPKAARAWLQEQTAPL